MNNKIELVRSTFVKISDHLIVHVDTGVVMQMAQLKAMVAFNDLKAYFKEDDKTIILRDKLVPENAQLLF